MPAPIPVELCLHDPAWEELACAEAARLMAAIPAIITVHHIGSTAIPDICAKPIIDLLPVVSSHAELENSRRAIEALGYAWWGEYGLAGRRYCTLDDPLTGRRKVQLHCYEADAPQIARHLAFRDYLRSRPDLARAYENEKIRCRDLHPLDSHAYTDCKDAWIRRIEAEALSALQNVVKD
jgi:GrpB-like predicted nucleotidyltransferase (UPF0157 family)